MFVACGEADGTENVTPQIGQTADTGGFFDDSTRQAFEHQTGNPFATRERLLLCLTRNGVPHVAQELVTGGNAFGIDPAFLRPERMLGGRVDDPAADLDRVET